MHAEAREFIAATAPRVLHEYGLFEQIGAIDLGGRETNGHARDLFGEKTEWVVVDAVWGPGVDVVANATTWRPHAEADLVLCAEVFEHTPLWPKIVANAYAMLEWNAWFITTMAGPGREVHGLNHDDPDQPGWYENIEVKWLNIALQAAGFTEITVEENTDSHDVYAWARK